MDQLLVAQEELVLESRQSHCEKINALYFALGLPDIVFDRAFGIP